MADFVSTLVEMGFDRDKSMKALQQTGNKGVEAAMEWMLSNAKESDSASTSSLVEGGGKEGDEPESIKAGVTPKSYKCDDCGKIFSSMETVEFHAAKTNHSNFSESTEEKKPLTAEEKAAQSQKLLEIMKQKRAEREAKEKLEEIQKEKMRMASGKDLIEAKQRLQEQEMKELIQQRKQDKLDDQRAKERVKAQIEADKLARRAKFGGGIPAEPVSSPAVSVKPSGSADETTKKEYTETKLQLRLPNGKTLVQTFGVNEPLAAVRVYIEINRDDGITDPFNLMTTFPRKVFNNEDFEKPLQVLGLVPSAVLMVTRT